VYTPHPRGVHTHKRKMPGAKVGAGLVGWGVHSKDEHETWHVSKRLVSNPTAHARESAPRCLKLNNI